MQKHSDGVKRNLSYDNAGISIFADVFPKEDVDAFVTTFYHRLLVQAFKLRLVNAVEIDENTPTPQAIDDLVTRINSTSKAALDFIVQSLRETPAANELMCNPEFLRISSEALGCPASLLKIHMDGILINLPKNETRLYKFHSEEHYYPQRRNFYNFWMPVIRDKAENNGAMIVKLGGHKKPHQFVEYTGFNAKESNEVSEADFFHQLQIPEDDIAEFEDYMCDLPANTAAFFHQNLPHTSTVNLSGDVTYTLIMRGYDYRYDPTLSDTTGVKTYTSAAARGGYPNLRPMPRL